MKNAVASKIDEAITVGLTCLEEGLDSKAIVKSFIIKAISQNSMPLQHSTLEELPTEIFGLLHSKLNIGFEIHDGKITSAAIENFGYNPVEKGINFNGTPNFGLISMLKGDENKW